jgi:hypothetical protein
MNLFMKAIPLVLSAKNDLGGSGGEPTATFGAAASQPTPGRRRSHGTGTTRAHGSDGDDRARAFDASFGWGEDNVAPPTA